MSQKRALAQEIRLGSPDRFSSWEGGVWGRDYWSSVLAATQNNLIEVATCLFGLKKC